MSEIGFVGLGTMGRPMVRRLLAAGHEVTVWNRSPGPIAQMVDVGASAAADIAEVFTRPIVLSILADDAAVRERIVDSGVLDGGGCRLHVNLATVSASLAEEAAAAHSAHGVGYVAAPVLGRAEVAEAGKLNVLLAGTAQERDLTRPILEAFAARVWELGDEPAQANVVKIAMNFLLGAAIESTAEAVALVEGYGVEATDFVDLVSSTLFPGPVYATYGGLMAENRYEPAGFTTRLGVKDTRLALGAAHARDLPLPMASLVHERLVETLRRGWTDRDWATLVELARPAAKERP